MFHSPRITTITLPVLLVISMLSSASALAVSTPTLGSAGSYAILASTFTNTTAGSTVTGGIGFTTGPAVAPVGVHPQYGPGAPYALAGVDQGSALSALASEPCTYAFPAGAVNLSTETTHGTVGVYTPGVYCSSGAMNIGGPLTLSGNGTFIFRANGALTSTAGAIVSLNSGASACNVFWTPTQATTLGTNTTFAGTVIDNAGITVGANTTWIGMALAFGGTVTTDTITISLCTPPVVSSSASSSSLSSSASATSSSLSSSSVSSSVVSSAVSSSSRSSSSVVSSSSRSASSSSVISSSLRSSSSSSRSVIFAPLDDTNPPTMILPQTGVDTGGMMISLLGMMLATIFVVAQGLARRRS